MPKVLCTLPNASDSINGIKFSPTDAGMVSDEVSQDEADAFALIPGYELVEPVKTAKAVTTPVKTETAPKGGKKATAAAAAADTPPAAGAAENTETPPAGGAEGAAADAGAAAGSGDGDETVF